MFTGLPVSVSFNKRTFINPNSNGDAVFYVKLQSFAEANAESLWVAEDSYCRRIGQGYFTTEEEVCLFIREHVHGGLHLTVPVLLKVCCLGAGGRIRQRGRTGQRAKEQGAEQDQ